MTTTALMETCLSMDRSLPGHVLPTPQRCVHKFGLVLDCERAPDLTLSMRAGAPSLVVTNEGLIPGDYWKPQAPVLNKRGLLERLKAGAQIAGASLSNPAPVLNVRVR